MNSKRIALALGSGPGHRRNCELCLLCPAACAAGGNLHDLKVVAANKAVVGRIADQRR